ncbi:Putative alcohol dehydrogenase, zinc-type, GroES-like superfamily, NAD(P)-binding domain superfamily [Septoria linicola]|uniref:Alcohol dehydrogenase, zinc-type, GroES-like superfamily, NAD(P)-binding domain superfamily n=1 Tax=Septoria linicola TaxID=215465 RepID=A0A9Q9ARD2_9PEZI|nr:Putative alcohol dehydrogenase, zinc-type, GroES-like superfamily, NAD(P)-binding domain superfamily [Septoria linicola]
MASFDIPETCKAGVVVNGGPNFHLEVQDVPVPQPGPGEILIKLNVTGLCGSDIHYMLGDLGGPVGMSTFGVRSPGHEGAGVVVKLGEGVTSWTVGERAGIRPMSDICHNCSQCWNGEEQYCAKVVHTGLMCTGSYQQYVVAPAMYTARIPDGVPDEAAGPIMCSASTMHCALREAGYRAGEWIVFPGGGGGVGIQGVQLARAMGMRPIVIDTGNVKKELATKLGAEVFIEFKQEQDIPGRVKEIADGLGAHGVVVTAWQSYKDAVGYIGDRVGGKIMCIGLPPAEANVIAGAPPMLMALKKMTITGAIVGTMQDTASALEYAKRGMLRPICEVRGLSAWPESVQQLRRGEVAGRIVIDFNKE